MNNHETGDKFFNVYVPKSATQPSGCTSSTATAYQSYFRVGGPDATAESHLLESLREDYAHAPDDTAVLAAFGSSATGGFALYTEGDLVQYIGGKSDTRVLNDSHVVHVLNKVDVDDATTQADERKTYRAYFRMGKPNADIEKPMEGNAPPDKLVELIKLLELPREALLLIVIPVDHSALASDVLGGDLDARSTLEARAKWGDPDALTAIEELRVSTDSRAEDVHDGKSAKKWALASLQAVHVFAANRHRDKALMGDLASRNMLDKRARDADPIVIRKLVELAESRNPAAAVEQNEQTPARKWAKDLVDSLGPASELAARFSLGDGIALYCDKAVTLSTPEALKVTVGKDVRTVLGETYSETYDVDQDVIEKIKDGWISDVSEVPSKKLVTAILQRRELLGAGVGWRTTKFDVSKALTFAANDTGSFTVGASFIHLAGVKFLSTLGVTLDSNASAALTANTSFKVELGLGGLETSGQFGKAQYTAAATLKGATSVTITLDPTAKALLLTAKTASTVVRIGMVAINAAVALYTASFAAVSQISRADQDGVTTEVKDMLSGGEVLYVAAQALNAVLAAIVLVSGVVQLRSQKIADKAAAASPVQSPNIVVNDAGIKMQMGANYIHIAAQGIVLCGTQVAVTSPNVRFLPAVLASTATPVQIFSRASVFGATPF